MSLLRSGINKPVRQVNSSEQVINGVTEVIFHWIDLFRGFWSRDPLDGMDILVTDCE